VTVAGRADERQGFIHRQRGSPATTRNRADSNKAGFIEELLTKASD